MRRAVVVGCGGIGFRHLQSLTTAQLRLEEIAVVDPDPERRVLAATEVRSRAPALRLSTHETAAALPAAALDDAVLVSAVTADLHFRVLGTLPAGRPALILLEKPVAQGAEALADLVALLDARWPDVARYVNCPRPLFPGYGRLAGRESLWRGDRPLRLAVRGESWGLGCNAVHFIDLFRHLTRASWLEPEEAELVADPRGNRRGRGFEEFLGYVRIRNERGQALELRCDLPTGRGGGVRVIVDRDGPGVADAVIDEAQGHLARPGAGLEPFGTLLTSESTGRFLENLAKGTGPRLPRLEEARLSHEVLFRTLGAATGRDAFAIT